MAKKQSQPRSSRKAPQGKQPKHDQKMAPVTGLPTPANRRARRIQEKVMRAEAKKMGISLQIDRERP